MRIQSKQAKAVLLRDAELANSSNPRQLISFESLMLRYSNIDVACGSLVITRPPPFGMIWSGDATASFITWPCYSMKSLACSWVSWRVDYPDITGLRIGDADRPPPDAIFVPEGVAAHGRRDCRRYRCLPAVYPAICWSGRPEKSA